MIDPRKCHGCCSCIVVCPVARKLSSSAEYGKDPYHEQMIILVRNGIAKVNNIDECRFCGMCADACPGLAISLEE